MKFLDLKISRGVTEWCITEKIFPLNIMTKNLALKLFSQGSIKLYNLSKNEKKNLFWGNFFFFFHLGFLSRTFTNHRTVGEGGGDFFLTPYYYFHPLHRHLDISRAITAENGPPQIASNRTRTENL